MDTRSGTSLTIGYTASASVWRKYLGTSPEASRSMRARVPTPTLVEKRKRGVAAVILIPDPAETGECNVFSGVEVSSNVPTCNRKYSMTTKTA